VLQQLHNTETETEVLQQLHNTETETEVLQQLHNSLESNLFPSFHVIQQQVFWSRRLTLILNNNNNNTIIKLIMNAHNVNLSQSNLRRSILSYNK